VSANKINNDDDDDDGCLRREADRIVSVKSSRQSKLTTVYIRLSLRHNKAMLHSRLRPSRRLESSFQSPGLGPEEARLGNTPARLAPRARWTRPVSATAVV